MSFLSNKSLAVRAGALTSFALTSLLSVSAFADTNGKPFAEIEESIQGMDARIDSLADALDSHLSSSVPVDVSVNCGAGEQISSVIAQYQLAQAPLNIAISGVCHETVRITRDHVTLYAAEPGAGIVSVTDLGAVTATVGADHIHVEGLSLTGSQYGAIAGRGAHITFNAVSVSAGGVGLLAVDNALAEISGSVVSDSNVGISANRGGVVKVDSTVLQRNTYGLIASSQAVILLTNTLPDTTPTSGVVVNQSGGVGAYARFGGQVILSSAQIQGAGFGLYVTSGGVLQLSADNVISGNQIGIEALSDTTVAVEGINNVVQGNWTGARCSGDANYFLGRTASLTVSGNTINNNACPF